MRLAVLNPRGRDLDQAFPDFAGAPDARLHPPVNHHAYAACTGGSFHKSVSSIPAGQREVLLLIRRDLALCLKTLEELQSKGKFVAVAVKECGLHQVAELLGKAASLALFGEICASADLCLAPTPNLVPIYQAAGSRRTEFIPTPYPVADPRWDFSIPVEKRRGIFIGTREFSVPSRNHLAALLCARAMSEPVTVINTDRSAGRRLLAGLKFEKGMLRVVEGTLPYAEYLRLMAAHRLVFQLDRSAVPGQVAGDALLCRLPCIGGDSAVERLVLPGFSGDFTACVEAAKLLLGISANYEQAINDSQLTALSVISFERVKEQLSSIL